MPGMGQFVHGRDLDGFDQNRLLPHPDRPPTAQKVRNAAEHNGPMYDTDTESFDVTRASLDDQDHSASDGLQDGDDRKYEQADQVYPENNRLELDNLMSQMNRDMARPGYTNTESYPPTTSGETDYDEESDDQVELERQQAQSHAKQARDFHTTKDSQKPIASTPMVIQTQPPRIQASKDHFKVTTKPTKLQKDVQHKKKSHIQEQQLFAKQVPQQFQAAVQTAATQKAPHMIPLDQPAQVHRQPARPQTTTTNHRQKHVDEANGHHQQYVKKDEPQEQHLNIAPSQQYDRRSGRQQQEVEDFPEEHSGPDLSSVDLDYELEELYKKDFDKLQTEPFEGPLHEDVHDASVDHSLRSLEQKLETLTDADVHSQKELFSSLKIEQWEEAGDWFQERFSEVFQKLKTARRKRRDLASEFEKRIAQRQQALTKKRKITEDALSEMKRSGSQVLEGTPKKKQRSTG
jgi:hypothetical protein